MNNNQAPLKTRSALRNAGGLAAELAAAMLILASLTQTVQAADTTAPAVAITQPAGGSTVSGSIGAVGVAVSASDATGVTKVELYVDGALDNSKTSSPYNFIWRFGLVANGPHTLMARAYDAAGNIGTASIPVTVNNPDITAPAVAITQPAGGSTLSGSIGAVGVAVSASDATGVTKVELYVDGALDNSKTSSPYNFIWRFGLVANGPHTLMARAYDAAGNIGTASIPVTVNNPDSTAPTVAVTAPANGASVSGSITVSANASDNVGVTYVRFLLDGNLLANADYQPPYAITWNTALVTNGQHTLSAVAADAANNLRYSSNITVTVNNADTTPPAIAFTAPAEGVTVSGSVGVSASASDNIGVTKVEFYIGTTLVYTDSGSPYGFVLDTRQYANGSRTITAKAYDAAGNTAVANRTVNINNPDTTSPMVRLTAPASGASVTGSITVSASAIDNMGVTYVRFLLDGDLLGNADYQPPYAITWNTTLVPNGQHTLSAVAADTANNLGYSPDITVTVNNADTTPPAIAFTAPAEGATVSGSVGVSASASDNIGVTKVEFYIGTTLVYTDSGSPYGFVLNTGQYADGSRTITAKAYDTAGNTSIANRTVNINNSDITAPTVAITQPVNLSVVSGNITVSGTAADNVGLAKVEVQIDAGAFIAAAGLAAWSHNAGFLPPGSHTITAKATNSRGNTKTASIEVMNTFNSTTILNNGAASKKVDIVFLGDGYTSAELDTYRADVQTFMNYLFSKAPFSDYKSFFNVHRVDVVSKQSGADNPNCDGTSVDTALDTEFNSTGSDCRALFTNSAGKVADAAASAPAADTIVIIVNTLTYGGAAGGYGVFYRGSSGPQAMVHELGHSFGWLADEYDYGGAETYPSNWPANEPNVSLMADRSVLKWGQWVNPATPLPTAGTTPDTPGLYEGAKYSKFGIYRPTYCSTMRCMDASFERVNYSLLVDRIFDYIPQDATPPQATLACGLPANGKVPVTLSASDAESYVLAYRLSTSPSFTDTAWQLASNRTGFTLSLPSWSLPAGAQTVYAQVRNGYGLDTMRSCQPSGAVSVAAMPPAGGVLATSEATVSIPPLAMPSEIVVALTDERTDDAVSVAEREASAKTLRYTALSSGIMLSPYGTKADKPISVTIPLKQAVRAAAAASAGAIYACAWNPYGFISSCHPTPVDSIFICAWDTQSKAWKKLPSEFDAGKNAITAETELFSIVKVFSTMPAAAPAAVGEVYVFPNPAKNGVKPVFHIETGPAEVEIQIRDFAGKLIHKETLAGAPAAVTRNNRLSDAYEYAWDAANAASGIYFYVITIDNENGKKTRKGKFAVIK